MAMLKSCTSHVRCSAYIQSYLELREGRERALAFDFGSIPNEKKKEWAKFMDSEREWAGIYAGEAYHGKGKTRTYQHFIISPDPRDEVSLETLRDLATEWAKKFFGDEVSVGECGSMQYAIVYHDDNKSGVPHAHIIVNNLNVTNGKRMQITAKQNKALEDTLQEMAKAKGLSYFDNSKPKAERVKQPRKRTRAERERIARGLPSWKEEIANKVFVASYISETPSEFKTTLHDHLEVEVRENKEGDYVYMDREDALHQVSGAKLGHEYTREFIDEFALRHQSPAEGFKEPMRKSLIGYRSVREEDTLTLEEICQVARTNMAFQIHHPEQYAGYIQMLEKKRKALDGRSPEWEECTAQIEALRLAQEAVSKGYLFDESGHLTLAQPGSQIGISRPYSESLGEATSRPRKAQYQQHEESLDDDGYDRPARGR